MPDSAEAFLSDVAKKPKADSADAFLRDLYGTITAEDARANGLATRGGEGPQPMRPSEVDPYGSERTDNAAFAREAAARPAVEAKPYVPATEPTLTRDDNPERATPTVPDYTGRESKFRAEVDKGARDFAAQRNADANAKALADEGYLKRSIRRSADTATSFVGGALDRAYSTLDAASQWGMGLVENILTGKDISGEQKRAIAENVDRNAFTRTTGLGDVLSREAKRDPGVAGFIETGRNIGSAGADLAAMALPGAAGVRGAAGFAAGNVLTEATAEDPNVFRAAVNGALAYGGMKAADTVLAKPVAALLERTMARWEPSIAKTVTAGLSGVGAGAGMTAAPHITKDGLHSALLGAIQGNPEDQASLAANVLLVAAFRAYGKEIPTDVAAAYVRGDLAKVPQTLRPLMDGIANPIIYAGSEMKRDLELRPDRPARFAADMEAMRAEGEARRLEAKAGVEPKSPDEVAMAEARKNPGFIEASVKADLARKQAEFQAEGARDRQLQESMKEATQRLINNGHGQSPTSLPLTTLIRERFGVDLARAKTVIHDLLTEGIIEPDLAVKELGPSYKRPESTPRSMVYTNEDAANAAMAAARRLAESKAPKAPTAPEASPPAVEPPPTAEAPTEPPAGGMRVRERGAADLGAIAEAPFKLAADLAGSVADEARGLFGSLIERLRTHRKPTADLVADKAVDVVDRTKRKIGEVQDDLIAVQKIAGSSPATPSGQAATALSKPTMVKGKTYGTSPLYDLIEGRRAPTNPYEEKIRDLGRRLIDHLGRMAVESGVKQFNPQSGEWDTFQNIPGGAIAPRIMTPEFADVMTKGPSSPLWNKVIDAFSELNKVPRPDVEEAFKARHLEMVGDGPDSHSRKAAVEFKRAWRQVPSAIVHDGQVFDLFESNPYTYFKRLAESRAARYSVVEVFGQDIPQTEPVSGGETDALMGATAPKEPPKDTPSSLRKKFADETGGTEDFVSVMRALHGQQPTKPIIDPSSRKAMMLRGLNETIKVIKAANLSGSVVPNLAEPVGNMRDFAGLPTLAKHLVRAAFQTKSWRESMAAAETMGAVTRDIVNLSYDPTRPVHSAVRIFSEVASRAFLHRFVNEFQEKLSASLALDVAARMKSGKGGERDVQRLMGIGMKEADARRLATGQGTDAEYAALVRRAPGQIVGANLSPAEKSLWEQNRIAKTVTAFASYWHMSTRNTANQAKAFVTTMRSLGDSDLDAATKWRRAVAATSTFTGHILGKTVQGAAGYMLASLATGGVTGLKIAASEATDDPADFAVKSFLYATVGGPLGAFARVVSGKSDIENSIYPVFVAKQVYGAVTGGTSEYANKDLGERLGQFFGRVAPVSRIVETGMAAVGLGSPEGHDIETARRAFYRWKYENHRPGSYDAGDSTEAQLTFRKGIRDAYDAVIAHKPPEVVDAAVMRALGVEGKKKGNVKAAIRAKKLLTDENIKHDLDSLKSRIGEDAYRLLELHDTILERLARTVGDK